ncbi:MAG: hypothetical protein H7Y01_13835 [Ferruginibacter sp.]|nr:hypothetical protein [Chitinophagaceae bacterium]
MKVYQRKIFWQLFVLRLIIIAAPAVIIYFLINNKAVLAIMVFLIFIIVGFLKIYGLSIHQDSFILHEYRSFTLEQRDWQVNKNSIDKLELSKNEEVEYTPDTGTILDVLILPALIMSGKRSIRIKGLVAGNLRKNKRIFINKKEFDLINNIKSLRSPI